MKFVIKGFLIGVLFLTGASLYAQRTQTAPVSNKEQVSGVHLKQVCKSKPVNLKAQDRIEAGLDQPSEVLSPLPVPNTPEQNRLESGEVTVPVKTRTVTPVPANEAQNRKDEGR